MPIKSRKYDPLREPASLAKNCAVLYRRKHKKGQSEGELVVDHAPRQVSHPSITNWN